MNASSPDPAAVASSLRALIAIIEAGEVEARSDEIAYLTGAADALERLALSSP